MEEFNMKNKKLIVIDLDGTALHDHIDLNTQTKAALLVAKEMGHEIVIATGRPARGSLRFYQELGLTTPSINFNGAYIHHPADEKFPERIAQIPMETILAIFKSEITEDLINAVCEYKDDLYVMNRDSLLQDWFFCEGCDSMRYGTFEEILADHPSGVILQVKPESVQKVMDFLRLNYGEVITCRQWSDDLNNIIEVFKSDSNKGAALAKVAEYLSFDSDDIIVFGDGDNDMEMFEFAGTSVAMENGLDELKAVASTITKSNVEGGIAHYLYEHLLK